MRRNRCKNSELSTNLLNVEFIEWINQQDLIGNLVVNCSSDDENRSWRVDVIQFGLVRRVKFFAKLISRKKCMYIYTSIKIFF